MRTIKLLSPVFGKEMVTLARRKRHYFSRGLFLAILLTGISIGWLSGLRTFNNPYSDFMDLSRVGHGLFMFFTIAQVIAVVVLMPALSAPVVAGEKERDTLSLLLMSNLGRYNILLDKLLSRMALLTLLLFSGLPLFLALLAFGGITPSQIAVAYILIFGTMLFCAGVGLFFSTILNKMHTALISTYAAMAAYFFGVILIDGKGIPPFDKENMLLSRIPDSGPDECAFFLVISMLVFSLSLFLCGQLLPRFAVPRKRSMVKRLFHLLNSFFEKINFTGVVVMDENKALGRDAIMWKEAHKHFFSSSTFLIRSCYTLLAVSMITLMFTSDWKTAINAVIIVCLILAAAIALVASSITFTSEREKHSFEVLMSSPLTARSIVMAKFIGTLKLTLPMLLSAVLWCAIGNFVFVHDLNYYSRFPNIEFSFRLLILVVSYLPMFVVIGLYSSAKRRHTSSAILQTVLVILMWSIMPIIPELLREFDICGVGRYLFEEMRFLSLSPVTSLFVLSDRNFSSWICALLIPCWIILLYVLIRRFDRIIGRQ